MTKIILGIDPGTKITGYGVIQTSPVELIDCGTIKPKQKSLPLRYKEIFEGLDSLVKHFKPSALAVETQFMDKNFQSTLKLGMAKGMAFLIAGLYDIPLFEYSPKEAKLSVAGSGKASKQQVQVMIQKRFGLKQPIHPEDASDALCLALTHYHKQNSLNKIAYV